MKFRDLLYTLSVLICGPALSTAGLIINPYAFGGGGGGGSPTFVINEGFEGAGTPAGWFNSGADFDYTTSPLVGTQSVRAASNGVYCLYLSGGALNHPEIWGKMKVRVDSLPSTFSQIFKVTDGAGTVGAELVLLSTGVLDFGSGITATTADGMAAATDYWVYFRYTKGTGSNSICSIGFSATETRPTSGTKFATTSGSFGAVNAETSFFTVSNGAVVVFDNLQISTTAFD